MQIPFEDFGGNGPLLHFAHANGYPPKSYTRLIEALKTDFHVIAIQFRPLWPNSSPKELKNWWLIAKDLITFFEQQGIQNVVGVGHSLGAVATVLAASMRPNLFSHLAIIEPVFLPNKFYWTNFLPYDFRSKYLVPPAKIALKRRDHWNSREEAFQKLRRKRVFAKIKDEVLWDFINHGLELMDKQQPQVRLKYSKEWEARIYCSAANPWPSMRKVSHPLLGLRGEHTNVLTTSSWDKWQKIHAHGTFENVLETGHLLPLEEPELVAQRIIEFYAAAS